MTTLSSTRYPGELVAEQLAGGLGHQLCVLGRALAARALEWQQRTRQRDALAALGDDQLADIGVTREAARFEAAKPFWKA